jgi:putative transposase
MSERKSAKAVKISRSSLKYQPRPSKDPELVERLKEIAREEKRYGYRRVWAELRREGKAINPKRVYRLWRREGLALRPRKRRKKVVTGATVPMKAERPGQVWTYDFLHDACENGRKLKILTVTDEFHRESLAIEVEGRLPSKKVLEVLARLFQEHGAPEFIRSDNDPEFVAKAVGEWIQRNGSQTYFIEPGSPWQNGYAESFHGKFRDECLNMEVFRNLAEAKVVIEVWRRRYNEKRPHSSLAYRTPLEYRADWEREQKRKAVNTQLSLSLCAPKRYEVKKALLDSESRLAAENMVLRQAHTSSVADWALGSLSSVALSSQPTKEMLP